MDFALPLLLHFSLLSVFTASWVSLVVGRQATECFSIAQALYQTHVAATAAAATPTTEDAGAFSLECEGPYDENPSLNKKQTLLLLLQIPLVLLVLLLLLQTSLNRSLGQMPRHLAGLKPQ